MRPRISPAVAVPLTLSAIPSEERYGSDDHARRQERQPTAEDQDEDAERQAI